MVRRDGVYTNAQGLHHFNEQLTEPIIRHIATAWEKTFVRRIPGVLSTLVTTVDKTVHTFHDEIEKRAIRNGGSMARFMMLKHNLGGYRAVVQDVTNKTKLEIGNKQKDINREFVPSITNAMVPAYHWCTEERGTGSFKRMKNYMTQHINENKQQMFGSSTETVQGKITTILKEVFEQLDLSIDDIFTSMKRDYLQHVTGINSASEERLPREQRKMRKDVLDIVNSAMLRFERVVGLASPSPEPDDQPEASVEAPAEEAGGGSHVSAATPVTAEKDTQILQPITENGATMISNELHVKAEHSKDLWDEDIAMSSASDTGNDTGTAHQDLPAADQVTARRSLTDLEPATGYNVTDQREAKRERDHNTEPLPGSAQVVSSPRSGYPTSNSALWNSRTSSLPATVSAPATTAYTSAATLKEDPIGAEHLKPASTHDRGSSDSSKENIPFDFSAAIDQYDNLYE